MRADAVRNRARILDAARALVAEAGVDVSMEEIARHAGVAVGTLYRHFPAKDDLVTAAVAASTARIADLADHALAGGDEPGPALERLFREIAETVATDRALKEAAGRLEDAGSLADQIAGAPPGSAEHRAVAAITALLDRARAAGQVRADVDLADLVVLLAGVPGAGTPAGRRERYVDVVLAGLAAAPLVRGNGRPDHRSRARAAEPHVGS